MYFALSCLLRDRIEPQDSSPLQKPTEELRVGVTVVINFSQTVALRFYCYLSVNQVWRERKPTRCNNQMFIINFRLNMFQASLCPSSGEQRPCVTACGVLRWFCWMWLVTVVGLCVVGCEQCEGYCSTQHSTRQRPTTATNHIQQNQRCTPHAVTHVLFSWRWA